MAKTPVNAMLDTLEWTPIEGTFLYQGSVVPYATHEAVLDIGGHKLRVYQLSDGERIINAEDFLAFFGIE